ncbi:acyltransferase family protein [Deinococcus sp.]|uniref:acyltransferase family protein n=1 Tax=Deinococcus sp. TaxID=47478 RepID=UPI003C7E8882
MALAYGSGGPFPYRPFVLKRWTRIWILYIVVVTLAALFALFLGRLPVPGLSVWFGGACSGRSVQGYLNHVLLIGNLESSSGQLVPVVWSLRCEMLASLASPLLLALSRKVSWLLLIGAALSIVGIRHPSGLHAFQFMLMFLVGIFLARHRLALVSLFWRMPRALRSPS